MKYVCFFRGLLHLTVLITNLIRFKGRIIQEIPQNSSTSKTRVVSKNVFGNIATQRNPEATPIILGEAARSGSVALEDHSLASSTDETKTRQELQTHLTQNGWHLG
jgi:hypothetical protein